MGDVRIDRDHEVRALARAMGIRAREGLREAITQRATDIVSTWLDEASITPESLTDVHDLVLNRVSLRVERIGSDADLRLVSSKYATEMRGLPVQLSFEFESDTEALVIKRPSAARRSASKFLAIIDARGGRRRRAWFSERHEAAHLVVPDPQTQMVMRRSGAPKKDPLENVIDAVASRVGFWEPIVRPALKKALASCPDIISAFELVHRELCRDASAEAAYRAFVHYIDEPLVLIRSSLQSRAADRDDPARSLALRATMVVFNDHAARIGLRVWPNYRIPNESIIRRAHMNSRSTLRDIENLGSWPCETGRGLRNVAVNVAARGAWAALRPT